MAELMADIGVGVDVNDKQKLAEAIIALLGHKELREDLAERGQRWARSFTLEKVVRKTFDTYLDVLKRDS